MKICSNLYVQDEQRHYLYEFNKSRKSLQYSSHSLARAVHFLLMNVLFMTLLPTVCVKPWWPWQLSTYVLYCIIQYSIFTPTLYLLY